MLKINYYVQQEFLIVELQGFLNYHTIITFEEEIIDLIKHLEINNIKFNLQDLEYLDESGFEKLMECFKIVKKFSEIKKI